MNEDRLTRIEAILRDAFSPKHLLVKDQSHLHAGHAGAEDGKGHYDVTIVSEAFIGQRPLARHRMIYDALGTMMDAEIHALRIDARVPQDDI
jgi:BolA protein